MTVEFVSPAVREHFFQEAVKESGLHPDEFEGIPESLADVMLDEHMRAAGRLSNVMHTWVRLKEMYDADMDSDDDENDEAIVAVMRVIRLTEGRKHYSLMRPDYDLPRGTSQDLEEAQIVMDQAQSIRRSILFTHLPIDMKNGLHLLMENSIRVVGLAPMLDLEGEDPNHKAAWKQYTALSALLEKETAKIPNWDEATV